MTTLNAIVRAMIPVTERVQRIGKKTPHELSELAHRVNVPEMNTLNSATLQIKKSYQRVA